MKRILLLCFFLSLVSLSTVHADILINEVVSSNATFENGHSYDWIELYNNGNKTVDLSGWSLSDSRHNLSKFTFPKGTKLKKSGFLTLFCTGNSVQKAGSGSTFYASFALSSNGETLYLTDSEGNPVHELTIPALPGNVSYGCPSGGGEYGLLENMTRGKKNSSLAFSARTPDPIIDTTGGFYTNSVTVMAHATKSATLRYTTDGETPTEKSDVFPESGLVLTKTTALRVRAFMDRTLPSTTISASFFLNEDPMTPIVSLISDDKYLFSKKTGILVKGSGSIPNYSKGWEYPVNIEYFNASGTCEINQMGTFTCSGHSARINAQKSIAIYARKALGKDSFAFNPFPTRDYSSYKSLLLRAANSDTYATRLRDIVASSLAEGEGILYQDHVIIQVFINGRYWGHYNLREKINKYFIAQYEDVPDEDIDSIDILARTGTDEFLQNGDNRDWLSLCDFCRKSDLNKPENLARVENELDIDSLFTHAAYEIILGNVDFTNVRIYRVPGGKWKYLLFDVEACWRGLDKTPLEYYIKSVRGKIQGFRHEPLNALLAVPEMKARFLNRVAEILEDRFQWPYVENKFNEATDVLEKILPRHISRWKNMKLSNWEKNISATKYYARVRPKKIPDLLKSAMKLTEKEVETYFGDILRLLEETNTLSR